VYLTDQEYVRDYLYSLHVRYYGYDIMTQCRESRLQKLNVPFEDGIGTIVKEVSRDANSYFPSY
jgi:hypothetical protein